jgi:hypothetical protein
MRDFLSPQVAFKRLEGICHGEDSPLHRGLSSLLQNSIRLLKNSDKGGGPVLSLFHCNISLKSNKISVNDSLESTRSREGSV